MMPAVHSAAAAWPRLESAVPAQPERTFSRLLKSLDTQVRANKRYPWIGYAQLGRFIEQLDQVVAKALGVSPAKDMSLWGDWMQGHPEILPTNLEGFAELQDIYERLRGRDTRNLFYTFQNRHTAAHALAHELTMDWTLLEGALKDVVRITRTLAVLLEPVDFISKMLARQTTDLPLRNAWSLEEVLLQCEPLDLVGDVAVELAERALVATERGGQKSYDSHPHWKTPDKVARSCAAQGNHPANDGHDQVMLFAKRLLRALMAHRENADGKGFKLQPLSDWLDNRNVPDALPPVIAWHVRLDYVDPDWVCEAAWVHDGEDLLHHRRLDLSAGTLEDLFDQLTGVLFDDVHPDVRVRGADPNTGVLSFGLPHEHVGEGLLSDREFRELSTQFAAQVVRPFSVRRRRRQQRELNRYIAHPKESGPLNRSARIDDPLESHEIKNRLGDREVLFVGNPACCADSMDEVLRAFTKAPCFVLHVQGDLDSALDQVFDGEPERELLDFLKRFRNRDYSAKELTCVLWNDMRYTVGSAQSLETS